MREERLSVRGELWSNKKRVSTGITRSQEGRSKTSAKKKKRRIRTSKIEDSFGNRDDGPSKKDAITGGGGIQTKERPKIKEGGGSSTVDSEKGVIAGHW